MLDASREPLEAFLEIFGKLLGRSWGSLGSLLGASWAAWRPPGSLLEPLGGLLELLGSLFGRLQGLAGVLLRSWRLVGRSWELLGSSWRLLGASWKPLGRFLGGSWGHLGRFLDLKMALESISTDFLRIRKNIEKRCKVLQKSMFGGLKIVTKSAWRGTSSWRRKTVKKATWEAQGSQQRALGRLKGGLVAKDYIPPTHF